MSGKCSITGKKPMFGNNVSHSQKKTRRQWKPNVQSKRIFVPELDRWIRVRVSTRALRSIDKIGLMAYLDKQGLTLKDIAL
ncbi:MAG: 50S ribosomal protein L28 [Chloroflexota bacterium]